jgi:hypothetical protein
MKIKKDFRVVAGGLLVSSLVVPVFSANAAENVEFKFSGQVSRAITFADNGTDTDTIFVDNNNSGTRLRLKGKVDLTPSLTAGVYWETQYQDNSSSAIDIGDADNASTFTSRIRDLWFKGNFGKVSLGQGNGAANGTSEVDFSGTTIADYSGNNLDDGISFADSAGNKIIKNGSVFSNFDGLSRNDRVRYDSPAFGPLGIAISGGTDKGEVGLRYSQKMGGGAKLGAALGYVRNDAADFNQLGLSASYLTSGGFNITGHYGERDNDAGTDSDGSYVKVGQKMGRHNLSLSYHKVNDLAAAGDEAERTNLAWRYDLRKGVEVFAAYQNASLDRAGGVSLEDQDIFSVGSRIKF